MNDHTERTREEEVGPETNTQGKKAEDTEADLHTRKRRRRDQDPVTQRMNEERSVQALEIVEEEKTRKARRARNTERDPFHRTDHLLYLPMTKMSWHKTRQRRLLRESESKTLLLIQTISLID